MDKEINKNEKKLIDMCKLSKLKILNGRMGRNRVIGNYTCCTSRGKIVVDYVITSVSFLRDVVIFMLMSLIYVCHMCIAPYVWY